MPELKDLDDPHPLGPPWWKIMAIICTTGPVSVAIVAIVAMFMLSGCSLAVGAIGGMSTVSGAITGVANKAYQTAVWGFDGPPPHLRSGHYMNQDMYGG